MVSGGGGVAVRLYRLLRNIWCASFMYAEIDGVIGGGDVAKRSY